MTFKVNAVELARALDDASEAACARAAVRVEARASVLCPVDTGRLRSSIDHEVDRDAQGVVARVGTNVEYAIYVEMGTRHMAAQPFLRPALDAGQP